MNIEAVKNRAERNVPICKWEEIKTILENVLTGVITRDECRHGLCHLVNVDTNGMNLNRDDILNGYKFWSGQRGYIIYVGETTAEGRMCSDYANVAIDQHRMESRGTGTEEFCNQYWEARLELARHWIKFIDAVIEEKRK